MTPSNMTVEAWPVTDAGQADGNEDTVLVYQPIDAQDARYSGSLYVVADGVGGGERGQTASRYAAQKVMYEYYNSDEPDLGLRLRRAIESANADLHQYVQGQPELVKMGTTLVAAAVRGEQLHVASVGDSRAYVIRDGEIEQITRDHTLVQQLLDEDAISPDEAEDHPRRDVVLRTLGAEEDVRIDIYDRRLNADDALLLCSDGLTHTLHEDEIAEIVATSSPRTAAETLVRKATDRGTKDNVTAVCALARDGAPTLVSDVPHTWDGSQPSFDRQATLAVPRVERPADASEEAAEAGAETVRAQPISPQPGDKAPPSDAPATPPPSAVDRQAEPPTPTGAQAPPRPAGPPSQQPAPQYQRDVQPAPQYGTSSQPPREDRPVPPSQQGGVRGTPEGYGQQVQPEGDVPIDPVTGLPPVPPQGDRGGQYAQTAPPPPQQSGGYQPRVYQPPAQPRMSEQRRGVSLGVFASVAVLAVLLTILMVLILVNPWGWQLPFGGDDQVAEGPAPTSTPTEETAPTAVPTQASGEAQPTDASTPAPTAGPTTAPVLAPAGMALIEGGAFQRGATDEEIDEAVLTCIQETDGEGCFREWFTDAQPVEEVTISPFFMDLTEVTNADYGECVTDGPCSAPDNTEFFDDPAFSQHPVVYVTYDQATTYCEWGSKRLPTEAEWEKAARYDPDTGESYLYPWGNNWEPGRANTAAAGLGGLAAVRAFPGDLSPWGMLDMGGNATEWVQDWYFDSYEGLGTLNPARLGNQPLPEPFRVGRGGSFQALQPFARSAHRFDLPPQTSAAWVGFRCAQDTGGGASSEPTPSPTPEEAATEEGTVEEDGDLTPTPTETPVP